MTGTLPPLRMFVATTTEVALVEVSMEMSRAMDILDAAGVLHDKSTDLLLAAQRQGRDLVAFAHHYVSLASAVQR